MKRKIFKATLMLMVLIAGLKWLWFCAEWSLHTPAFFIILGICCTEAFIWFFNRNKIEEFLINLMSWIRGNEPVDENFWKGWDK